jgi:hypothetical protein
MKKAKDATKGRKVVKQPMRLFNPSEIARLISDAFHEDIGFAPYSCRALGNYTDPEIARFAVDYQRVSTLKKFKGLDGVDAEVRRREAFGLFRHVNAHMASFSWAGLNLPIIHDYPAEYLGFNFRDRVLLLARKICHYILRDLTVMDVFLNARHSNGSSQGVPFLDTSLERKWDLPLTGTADAITLFKHYRSFDPLLSKEVCGERPDSEVYCLASSSQATTVDKTSTKDRFIAVEPTLNMFFQQGVMAVFYDRLRFLVDMTHAQDKHKALALQASRDGTLATIDWSSASDCVSTGLLKFLLPRTWFEVCDLLRTGFVNIDGSHEECHMFATMGNATTFPLETLVFLSIGLACVQIERAPRRVHVVPDFRHITVSVFGDDCILPTRHAEAFIRICESVGFIVNNEKTFIDPVPGFRESCGGDFFRGSPVRPVFMKDPVDAKLSSLRPWLSILMNQFCQKYIQYFGVDQWYREKRLWPVLRSIFQKYDLTVLVVPEDYPDDSGVRFFRCEAWELLGFPVAPVKRGLQGFTRFEYLKFEYPKTLHVNQHLRYLQRLRTPKVLDDVCAQYVRSLRDSWGFLTPDCQPAVAALRPLKRNGRYVVASSWTSRFRAWSPLEMTGS